jgi:phycoerythrin-associated linker protein
MVGFTYLFQLLRGASSSDKNLVVGNNARLTNSLITNNPSPVIPPSGSSSYGGITDVNKLLANVFKAKPQPTKTQPTPSPTLNYRTYLTSGESYSSLQQQYQEQALIIEQLEQKLTELNSLSTIATSQLSKWESRGYTTDITSQVTSTEQLGRQKLGSVNNQNLQLQVEEQKKAIANLQEKIAQAQSVATIGEARLNKWRSRFFS